MIIEAPYKHNDTVTVKTAAGEEVVARFVEEDNTHITVMRPLAIVATQQGIGLGPFGFTISTDSKVTLNKSAILFIQKTDAEMAKQYVSNTSGLQLQ